MDAHDADGPDEKGADDTDWGNEYTMKLSTDNTGSEYVATGGKRE